MENTQILYETGKFYVIREKFGKIDGFAVYQNGYCAATRVAQIGYQGQVGLDKAKAEADRRGEIMTVLASPENVCRSCSHTKTFHAWLRTENQPKADPVVTFGKCGKRGCQCENYIQDENPRTDYDLNKNIVNAGDAVLRCPTCSGTGCTEYGFRDCVECDGTGIAVLRGGA